MDTNTQSNQSAPKYELKEFMDADKFKGLLKEMLNAMEQGEDLVVNVKGKEFTIPKEALQEGRFRSEYEIDKGEFEYELQLKWRTNELNTKQ